MRFSLAAVIGALMLISGVAFSQIADVKTTIPDTAGFSGDVDLSYAEKDGATNYSLLSGEFNARYKTGADGILSLSFGRDLGFRDNVRFMDENSQQLQYSHNMGAFGVDVFANRYADYFDAYNAHMYVGAGPHISVSKSDTGSLAFGAAFVHELATVKGAEEEKGDNLALGYVDASIKLTDALSVGEKVGFMPRVAAFKEYKLSSGTSVKVDITKSLAVKTAYDIIYATNAEGKLEKERSDLKTGLVVGF